MVEVVEQITLDQEEQQVILVDLVVVLLKTQIALLGRLVVLELPDKDGLVVKEKILLVVLEVVVLEVVVFLLLVQVILILGLKLLVMVDVVD
jgi:hypothetical protein